MQQTAVPHDTTGPGRHPMHSSALMRASSITWPPIALAPRTKCDSCRRHTCAYHRVVLTQPVAEHVSANGVVPQCTTCSCVSPYPHSPPNQRANGVVQLRKLQYHRARCRRVHGGTDTAAPSCAVNPSSRKKQAACSVSLVSAFVCCLIL
jgi:hypothetical protein